MKVPSNLLEALEVFEPVIGLEVHAQLKSQTKLFCAAPNQYDPDRPNAFVDEYCLGLPGVLPVLNGAAVDMAVRAGLALGCQVHTRSVWSRKQYFYPDLPKGYQISQYDEPICQHGLLEVPMDGTSTKRVGITRIHMEEDAGKNIHVDGAPFSLVDYNRSGVPLIEIVSEPDIRTAQEAAAYLRELRSILMTLEVCDGNMEEGSFRCDANVSIRPRGQAKFGTRCEIKNMNSFRFVEQAIEFEILRHARVITQGGTIHMETRLFDSGRKETRSMRSKEEAHDYRYFPDPDLPPLEIAASHIEALRDRLPELPAAKRKRYVETLGIPAEHAVSFSEEPDVAAFFDSALLAFPASPVGIANLIKGEVLRELKDAPEGIRTAKLTPKDAAELVRLKETDKISSTQQKKLFGIIWRDGTPLHELLEQEGQQIDDPAALQPLVDKVIDDNPGEVEKYRNGKTNVLGFFVGQVMKLSQGKAKPPLVKELVIKRLDS
jgi:aspartyl-tRNA(Asn)/glutamyl-tRNA(Gln) amidotransferase subunit B